jgi:hypothetical protein
MTRHWPGGRGARCLGRLAFVGWCSVVLIWPAGPAAAHPLGDFTVNTHVGIRVEPAAVALDVVVDIAEVPALRAFPALGDAPDDPGRAVPETEQRAYRDRLCPALLQAVSVRLRGRPVHLELVSSSLSFPPGSAGLATARLECALRSSQELSTVDQELVVTDSMAVQPIGWREITAVGDGVELSSSNVPSRSPSEVLRSYPEDMLDDPLDHREARLHVAAGSGVVTGPYGTGGPGRPGPYWVRARSSGSLTDLVGTRQLSVGFGVAAVGLAVLLGSLHAFAPGTGKTLMAAYLVGRNGTLREAALIGTSVTRHAHAGVLVLGVLVSVAVVSAPERVYSWLSLASGLLLVAIGVALLRAGWRRWLSGDSEPRHGTPRPRVTGTATATATATGTATARTRPRARTGHGHGDATATGAAGSRAGQARTGSGTRPGGGGRRVRARQAARSDHPDRCPTSAASPQRTLWRRRAAIDAARSGRSPQPARRRLRRRPGAQPVGPGGAARRHRARPYLVRRAARAGLRDRHGARARRDGPAAGAGPRPDRAVVGGRTSGPAGPRVAHAIVRALPLLTAGRRRRGRHRGHRAVTARL